MAAAYQELFLDQGSNYNTNITLDDVYGDAFDLTGYTAKSQIKKSYYSNTVSGEFIITINSPQNGTIILSMSAATSANIAPGRYVYDVIIKSNSSNTITRVLEGIVNVNPHVSSF